MHQKWFNSLITREKLFCLPQAVVLPSRSPFMIALFFRHEYIYFFLFSAFTASVNGRQNGGKNLALELDKYTYIYAFIYSLWIYSNSLLLVSLSLSSIKIFMLFLILQISLFLNPLITFLFHSKKKKHK